MKGSVYEADISNVGYLQEKTDQVQIKFLTELCLLHKGKLICLEFFFTTYEWRFKHHFFKHPFPEELQCLNIETLK